MKSALFVSLLVAGYAAYAGEHVVIIDPGHGGSKDAGSQAERSLSAANNATSPSGLQEKDLTLELSLEIRSQIHALAALHPGTKLDCRLTRTDDRNVDFIRRTEFCATTKPLPSAIVSIHFNALTGGKALGSLAVIRGEKLNPNYRADAAFATGLIRAANVGVAKFVPGSHPRAPITDAELHGGAGSNFFYQLGKKTELSKVPKCFLEVEFIDRSDVDQKLLKDRKTTFPVIAKGIAEYLYAEFP